MPISATETPSLLVVNIGQQLHHKIIRRNINNKDFFTEVLGDAAASLFTGVITPLFFQNEDAFHVNFLSRVERIALATKIVKHCKFYFKNAIEKLMYISTDDEEMSDVFVNAMNVLDIPSSDREINLNDISFNDIMKCYIEKVGAPTLEISNLLKLECNGEQYESRKITEQLYESSKNLLVSVCKNPNLMSRTVKRLVKQKWNENRKNCSHSASSDTLAKMNALRNKLEGKNAKTVVEGLTRKRKQQSSQGTIMKKSRRSPRNKRQDEKTKSTITAGNDHENNSQII